MIGRTSCFSLAVVSFRIHDVIQRPEPIVHAVARAKPSMVHKQARWIYGSAEGERVSFRTWIEKLDLEQSIGDRLLLPDQLIKPLLADRAVA